MGRLLRLLFMFGPMIYRAYRQYERTQQRTQGQRGGYNQAPRSGRASDKYKAPPPPDNSKYIKSGSTKYKEYDYIGAVEDFTKALEINPRDTVAHFNIACAYSLIEDANKSFVHLDQAVANGFDDFEKIKTHDGLAYLRVQSRFDKFQKNGFRLVK